MNRREFLHILSFSALSLAPVTALARPPKDELPAPAPPPSPLDRLTRVDAVAFAPPAFSDGSRCTVPSRHHR